MATGLIRKILALDILKSITIAPRVVYANKSLKKLFSIFIFKKSYIEISKSSKIIVNNGNLLFNRSRSYPNPFPSLLKMGTNAALVLNGDFTIFSSYKIYINDNAVLLLGSGDDSTNLNIGCYSKIEIGENVAISENVV